MLSSTIKLWFIALLLVPGYAMGQGDFFWSFQDLNSGATNSAAEGTFAVGETGSLYLYYSTMNSELDTGAGLDISLTNSGVVEFSAAETFDFDICLFGGGDCVPATIDPRWVDAFGPAQSVTSDTITGLNAFTVVNGMGILNSNTGPIFLDAGYDFGAEAFLFGRVDFVATGVGTTNLETSAGAIGIVHDGQTVNPIFGGASINVVPVPEPALSPLVILAAVVLRRKRR